MCFNVDLKCTLTQIQLELFKRYELYNMLNGQLYKDNLADEINRIMQIGQERLLVAPQAEIDAYKTFKKELKSWRNIEPLRLSNLLGRHTVPDVKYYIL